MKIAIIYILISVVTSTVGQLLLKIGMNNMGSITLSSNQFLFDFLEDGHQSTCFYWPSDLFGRNHFLAGGTLSR